ncbi:MAG: hypothetical protein B6I36_10290 [Desulfobacteraceae bacterium 4572_35.1]|nr:MAG: hypothetical protein B6I36_10290 [Desulfobacteraceae bacterium 4572_35.1]
MLTLWARDSISVEMMVGHILQNLTKLQATVEADRRKVHQLQFTLESLISKVRIPQKTSRGNKSHKD